ncbi:MAG: hypothetical protein KBS56_03490 [Clostridiales bacterium]|nr:hypothetical protein [Candidatus Crickella equi]
MKRFGSLLLALVVTLTMSFSVVTVASFAEEQKASATTVVSIQKGDTVKGTVDLSTAKLKKYTYSFINNAGTVKKESVKGVTVKSLLDKYKVKVKKNQAVEFVCGGSKPGSITFNYSDLFGTRYCYKSITKLNADKGIASTKKAKKAKKAKVAPVIAVEADSNGENCLRLYFGQKYITERNMPLFYDHVEAIKVVPAVEKKVNNDPIFATESKVAVGTTLEFDVSKVKNDYIYYTVNGKKPTVNNARIYNYAPKATPAAFNKYKFKKTGTYTVKAVVKSCCNTSSKVVTKKIKVVKELPTTDETK